MVLKAVAIPDSENQGRHEPVAISGGTPDENVMHALWLVAVLLLVVFSVGRDRWATDYEQRNGDPV